LQLQYLILIKSKAGSVISFLQKKKIKSQNIYAQNAEAAIGSFQIPLNLLEK